MASTTKPQNTSRQVKHKFLSSNSLATPLGNGIALTSEQLEGLLHDGITTKQGTYGAVLFVGSTSSYVEFKVEEDCRFWATSGAYSDGGGSSGNSLDIYRYNNELQTYQLFKTVPTTTKEDWYVVCDLLTKGTYKIQAKANYVQFNELYFESLVQNNSLILHDDEYKKFIPQKTLQPKDTNLVPIMTSNTSPKGKVTANYENDPAWGAFDDETKARSFWFSSDSNSPNNQWLQYEFEESMVVNKVSLQSALSISGSYYGIKNFTILGSNDGVAYVELFSGVHPNNSSEVSYSFSNENSYKIYRIKGNSYNSDSQMLISSFKMFGDEILSNPSHWSTVSSTLPTSTKFLEQGDNLSVLDRTVTKLEPMAMTPRDNILGSGEIGKVFSKTVDLKKYFDIRGIETEVR